MSTAPTAVDLLSHLIPACNFITGFTTSEHISHPHLTRVRLADATLGVHKVFTKTSHTVVTPPSVVPSEKQKAAVPNAAWEASYPRGSINPSADIPGGFGFYLTGPPAFQEALKDAHEAVFSYRMMLQKGWKWAKGGKLPGVCKSYGGVGDSAYGCSGGRQDERCKCFGLRPMWRASSLGELYTYLPLTKHNKDVLTAVPPRSIENSDYGMSVGRGAFNHDNAVGNWVSVAFRVKLNDVGVNNGEVEIFIDGESVIFAKGLSLRCSEEGKIKGMHFQTFFGGHSSDWASPENQHAWFADVTGAILC